MIDKVKIASKNWADDYIQKHGNQVTKLLQCAYTEGFMKGVELSERKHGHWIFDGLKTTRGNDYGKYTCSECGTDFPDARRHCAECGALMDGPLEHVEYEYYSSDKNKMHTWHGHG